MPGLSRIDVLLGRGSVKKVTETIVGGGQDRVWLLVVQSIGQEKAEARHPLPVHEIYIPPAAAIPQMQP